MFRHVEFPPARRDAAGTQSESQRGRRRNPRSLPRTQRACDLCRQMKIKCDGANPCRHCTLSFSDCVYSEPLRKRRRVVSPPEKLDLIESRLRVVEESCRQLAAAGASPAESTPSGILVRQSSTPSTGYHHDNAIESSELEAPATGGNRDNPPSRGEARFVGSSADRAFVERLRAELGEWPGADFERRLIMRERPGPKLFPHRDTPTSSLPLPPFKRAEQLVNLALDSQILYQVVYRPRFDCSFRLLFSLDRQDYGEDESRYILLVYALMALGTVYEKHDAPSMESGNEALREGTKYFDTCRDLVDLGNCSDLTTLQTIFYMNLFLVSTDSLASCYTYLSHALSLAFRLNLHQSLEKDDAITAELKLRLFWSIKQLLTAVAAVVGLPRPIADDQIDLPFPADFQDCALDMPKLTSQKSIDRTAINVPGLPPFIKLHSILDRVVKTLYPTTGVQKTKKSGSVSHCVSNETIMGLEKDLQAWANSLPSDCRLGNDAHPAYLQRANYELYMTYCHVQVFLYRPFLHYLVERNDENSQVGKEFQMYASACIHASCNIINLAEDMFRSGDLFGSQWRILHMVFASALSLLYVVLGCDGSKTAETILIDLNVAKRLLKALRPYSVRSQRAHMALTILTTIFSKPQANYPVAEGPAQPIPQGHDPSYTASLGEKALRIPSRGYQNYALPADTVEERSARRATRTAHPLPLHSHVEGPATAPAGEPQPLSHIYHDNPLQSNQLHPGVNISGSLPTINLAEVPIQMGVGDGVFHPELPFNDNIYYLEARPFDLLQDADSNGDSFLQFLGADGTDLHGITENFPGLEEMFQDF